MKRNHGASVCYRDRIASDTSWSPAPIPEDLRPVPGFPGEEAFDAAMFLVDCAARLGRVDSDVRRECPFLLQVCPLEMDAGSNEAQRPNRSIVHPVNHSSNRIVCPINRSPDQMVTR